VVKKQFVTSEDYKMAVLKANTFTKTIGEVLGYPTITLNNGQQAIAKLSVKGAGVATGANRTVDGIEQVRTQYTFFEEKSGYTLEVKVPGELVQGYGFGAIFSLKNVTGGTAGTNNNVVWVNAESMDLEK
jgi:hypothetical protein